MAVPNIILDKPMALVQPSSSPSGLETTLVGYIFGIVVLVYDTSDKTEVNQTVLFNPENGQPIQSGTDFYYLIEEQYLLFRENPLP